MTDARRAAEGLLGLLAALFLAVLAALTFVDVVGRSLLNAPVPGAFELVEMLVAGTFFAALPVATARGMHITIDLLDPLTPARLGHWRDALMHLVAVIAMGVVSWRLGIIAGERVEYGDVTAFLRVPLYPVAVLMTVLASVTALVALLLAVTSLRAALGGGADARR